MNKIKRDIINIMKFNKDGSPDKRFKKKDIVIEPKLGVEKNTVIGIDESKFKIKEPQDRQDPNELHAKLLKDNNLKLDFDVLEGTIATKYGIIKLERPTLVIRANYVSSK